jgi:hypothetical protein
MSFIKCNLFYSFSCVLLALFLSCTKNVAGPKGEPGTPAKQGNVVQKHINSFTQPTSEWYVKSAIAWESLVFSTELTRDVVKKGVVKVYMQIDQVWWALPHADGNDFTQYSIEENFIRLNHSNSHGGFPQKPEPVNFRIVIFLPVQ